MLRGETQLALCSLPQAPTVFVWTNCVDTEWLARTGEDWDKISDHTPKLWRGCGIRGGELCRPPLHVRIYNSDRCAEHRALGLFFLWGERYMSQR